MVKFKKTVNIRRRVYSHGAQIGKFEMNPNTNEFGYRPRDIEHTYDDLVEIAKKLKKLNSKKPPQKESE